ncbi:MAG: SRPBCC family protein [Saprospiraceae bacterium]|nr:SRPBCC family protein [Saprospiraceae bacterium]
MNQSEKNSDAITIRAIIAAPVDQVWDFWIEPKHITKWCSASEEWHAPKAENDLKKGGKFLTRMEAKDGSFGFDFGGIYTQVEKHTRIDYVLDDGRQVGIQFLKLDNGTEIVQCFDPEQENSREMQKQGWQSILDNFKKYAEHNRM